MKNKKMEISRRKFITNSACGGLATLGATGVITSCVGSVAENSQTNSNQGLKSITLRPYQLLCATCSIGEDNIEADRDKINAIRNNPDRPVTLVCNAGDIFAYQDPGPAEDLHGNFEFNRKRDLEILQRIDIPPGITLPARIILHRMWDSIESVKGICDCDDTTDETCKGCPKADSGFYEKGREISLLYSVPGWNSHLNFTEADLPKAKNAIIVPRTLEERTAEKKKSIQAMEKAEAIGVRPHILMCSICQYGLGDRPPFETDNLPEMLQYMFKNPEVKIRIAEAADWMMCAPCPSRNKAGACYNVKGRAGLTSQLRDVRILHKLGLSYGEVINARELYRRMLKHIPSTAMICGSISKGVEDPSVWDDECGHHTESLPEYLKGRKEVAQQLGIDL